MTVICPAEADRFSESEWIDVNVWAAMSSSVRCPCCGDPLIHLEAGIVEVRGAIGMDYAMHLAAEIGSRICRPLAVRVQGPP